MKRIILSLLLLATLTAEALASTVKQLDIWVVLHRDGSASIEERWLIDLDRSDAKTEWYVAHNDLGDMRIENFTVEGYIPGHKELMPFETLPRWDVKARRDKKAGKCGLANHGQEMCWGFGDWGEHEYVIRYDLTHLVKSYDTCDGFNHCFVDMNCPVEDVMVSIEAEKPIALSEENTRRWAFGCQGTIEFDGNAIVMTPGETLTKGKRVIVMLEMDKGMFTPDTEASEPWADRKQRALKGNDYENNTSDEEDSDFWDVVYGLLFTIAGFLLYLLAKLIGYVILALFWLMLYPLWWIVSLAPLRTWIRRRKLGIEKGRYCRDVNKEWTLVKNKMVMDDLAYTFGMSNENIIGAVLLRLMARGDLTIVHEVYKKKEHDMLKILKPVREIDKSAQGDERLCCHALRLLTLAAGDDLVLQPNEFKNWCKVKKHHPDIKNFLKLMDTKYDKKYVKQHAADIYGMKAFLNDFSLLNERSTMEVKLWDEYMVYAEFFGIADKVKDEMWKVCPDYLRMSKIGKSLEAAYDNNIVYVFSDSIYSSANSVVERAASRSISASDFSSGHSSFSSSGGGGGFSGGGGGGGR